MALNVGKLMVQLGFEDTGFKAGMQGASQDYQNLQRSATQSAQSVEKAAAKVQSARAAESAAAVRVKLAEEALERTRADGNATSTQIAQAESRVQTARAQSNMATVRAKDATRGLAAAQKQAASSTQDMAAQQQKATTSTNNLATAAGKAKNILATLGVGLSMAAVVKGLTDSVGAARALGAQTNQLDVLFGKNAGQISAWGKTAVDSMRMSQREAQGTAIQFATFGKAAGLAGQDLVGFSQEATKLAADLASFHGIPVADAIQAMGSAMAGETETIRQYGVLLDEATIKEAAYSNGIAQRGAKLSQQQKTMATYVAMQQQLAHVNGDVERSNGKFGASLKTLTAKLEETQAAVGSKLIPVIQPFVDLLAGPGLDAVQGIASAVGLAGQAFGSLPGPVQAALAAIVAFRIAQRLAGDQMSAMGGRVTGLIGGFRGMSDQMRLQAHLAAMNGQSIGRMGSAIAVVGQHIPIIKRMQIAFVDAAAGASRFPRAAGAASAAMTGMRGAASGLIGVMGGPWGLAIAGATAVLGLWMGQKQKDAAASQAAEAATHSWAEAIHEANGAITDNIRQMVTREMSARGAYAYINEAGMSERELTDAVLAGGDAYDKAREKVLAYAREAMAAGNSDLATGLTETVTRMDQVAEMYGKAGDEAQTLARANGQAGDSFGEGASQASVMSDALKEFDDSADGAASKVDKLAKSLSDLGDDALTEEEALQAAGEAVRDLGGAFETAGAAAVSADGSIDVVTESGGKLQDSVIGLRDAYNETAAAAYEHAQAQNMGPAAALDYVKSKVDPLRQSLIDQAMAAGVSADAAQKMADRYLGLPDQVVTNLELRGTDAAIAKLDEIGVKGAKPIQGKYVMTDNTPQVRAKLTSIGVDFSIIDGQVVINQNDIHRAEGALNSLGATTTSLPDGFVKITDTSAENMQRLHELGVKTQTLPDGTVVIKTDESGFWGRISAITKPVSKVVNIISRAFGGDKADGGIREYAEGSMREYADGAMRRPAGVPKLPDHAVIEHAGGPGLIRWAEEGAGPWEAFIPGKKNARTTAILAETASRLGYQIIPADALRSFAGGAVLAPRPGENGLQAPAIRARRMVFENWPEITDIGGYRPSDPYPDHPSGLALDIMTGRSPGDEIYQWLHANADVLGLKSTIWQQQYHPVGGSPNMMEDRGDPTQNHMDHIHALFAPADVDPGVAPEGVTDFEGGMGGASGGDIAGVDGGGLGGGDASGATPVYVTNWPGGGMSAVTPTGGGGGGSSSSGSGESATPRKKLFTIGGGKIYDPNPEERDANTPAGGGQSEGDKVPKASTLEAAQHAVEKAKRKQEETTEAQRIAEMKLDEVRANPKAKPSQIEAAELAVTKAKNANTTATEQLSVAELRLQEIQEKGSTPGAKAPAKTPVKRLSGGTIPGTGRGDIIPMMGEPGEEVIRRSVATRPGVREALKHLNRTGLWPEFHADGGTVGGFTSGFGGYQHPSVAKVGLLDHKPQYWMEQAYRLGTFGYGGAAMAASGFSVDGQFQGFSTGSSSFPILDDIAKKLDEVIKEGRVGSIGIYVGDGGQIVVEDMGDLKKTQDQAAQEASMRNSVMRT